MDERPEERPPRLAEWLLASLWPSADRELLLGDLEEDFRLRRLAQSPLRARLWYWSQALRGVPQLSVRTLHWWSIMFLSYLRSTLRHVRRHKGYAFINISGLAVGLACGILILLFVLGERSYDRFHTHSGSIYRLLVEQNIQGNTRMSAGMPGPLAEVLAEDVPEIEAAVRLWQRDHRLITRPGQDSTALLSDYEDGFLYADPAFLSVFSFPLAKGNPDLVLAEPRTIVLTAPMAEKYFGGEDPVGQTLIVTSQDKAYDFRVSGVLEDIPAYSSIQFSFLTSFASAATIDNEKFLLDFGWRGAAYPTFVLLKEGVTPETVEAKFQDVMRPYVGDESVASPNYTLEPLTDVYLRGQTINSFGPQGNPSYVYIFATIALAILLIAAINYMTLATARSERRSREVGVRKVVGARRGQLAGQFLGESLLFCMLAAVLAVGLIYYALPFFRDLVGRELDPIHLLTASTGVFLLGLVLLTGLLSGTYPALLLSRFQPGEVLKGHARLRGDGALLRRAMVTLQFVLSSILLISTLVIRHQLGYLHGKDLGYEHEQIVVMNVWNTPLRNQEEAFKQELLRLDRVEHVTLSSAVPSRNVPRIQVGGGADQPAFQALTIGVDEDFMEAFDMELVSGQGFGELSSDETSPVILNETSVRTLGLEDPIGKTLPLNHADRTIVGVVRDFHLLSLHSAIEPMVLAPSSRPSYVSVRMAPGDFAEALGQVGGVWKAFAPDYPFEYFFLEEALERLYSAEERLADLFYAFALIAVFIACLGLFGLVSFTAERRTREISIRKVFGASDATIVGLLTRDFLGLVAIAFVLAVPLSYFSVQAWLQNFAYRTEPGPGIFLLAGLLLLLLTVSTAGYQALRVARANPIDALRQE